MTELETLQKRWRKLMKEEMPDNIARQHIVIVRRAVEYAAKGMLPAMPSVPVTCKRVNEDSLRDWDTDSNY